MFKKLIILMMCILMISLVVAVPPITQISLATDTLEIAYPKYNYAMQDQDFTLHFHVFNSSDLLNNSQADCFLHLYASYGNHTLKEQADYDAPDFEVLVGEGNFSDLGVHAYIIYCNTTSQTGFASGNFIVTPKGVELLEGQAILYTGFLILLTSFLIASIYGIFSIKHYIGKFALYWVSHILVIALTFSIWQVSNNFLIGYVGIAGVFRVAFYFMTIAVFPMVILSIAWIVYIHTITEEMDNMIERGMTPEEAFKRSAYGKRFQW